MKEKLGCNLMLKRTCRARSSKRLMRLRRCRRIQFLNEMKKITGKRRERGDFEREQLQIFELFRPRSPAPGFQVAHCR